MTAEQNALGEAGMARVHPAHHGGRERADGERHADRQREEPGEACGPVAARVGNAEPRDTGGGHDGTGRELHALADVPREAACRGGQ